jgi:hypothetical protein
MTMKTIKKNFGIAACIGILAASATSVFGQIGQVIHIDEMGSAYITASQPFAYTVAPEPNSAISTLEYTLPFAGVAGDVLLTEPGGSLISDVLRFDGNFHVYFFSDVPAEGTDLADVGLPSAFLTPNVTIPELGPEGGFQYAYYTPTSTQPGYKSAAPGTTYYIVSDVPEPGVVMLGSLGGGLLLLLNLRRRAKRD